MSTGWDGGAMEWYPIICAPTEEDDVLDSISYPARELHAYSSY